MKKIKILYIIGTMLLGGAESHLVDLLNNLDRKKFEPHLLCLSQGGPLLRKLNKDVRYKVLGYRAKGKFDAIYKSTLSILKIRSYIKKNNIDIFHGYLFHAYALGSIAAKLAGLKTIISSRRSLPDIERPIFLSINRLINPLSKLFICNSHAIKKQTTKIEKIDPKKITVIYNGKDINTFKTKLNKNRLKKQMGIPLRNKVVVIVANLIWYKGHKYLIEAAEEVVIKHKNTTFLLVGEGPMKDSIIHSINKNRLSDNFILVGNRTDVPDILRISDISILTSYSEGFSNTILESMAARLPVIATKVGGNKESVIDGKTGFFIPSKNSKKIAEKLTYLLTKPKLARKMGEEGYKLLKDRFTLKKMVKEFEETYNAIQKNI